MTRARLARRAWAGHAPRRVGVAGAEHHVGPAVEDGLGDAAQVGRVEGAVAVHEADDAVGRVGRQQAGPAGGAEAAAGLVDHPRPAGPGQVGGAVVRPVVDDDGGEAVGHGRQQVREGAGLVEHGDDDVGHQASSGPHTMRRRTPTTTTPARARPYDRRPMATVWGASRITAKKYG